MKKHKRLIVFLLIILVGIGIVFLIWQKQSSDKKNTLTVEDINILDYKTPPALQDFKDIKDLVEAEKWAEVIEQSQKYAKRASNNKSFRISSYGYCVLAATKLKNTPLAKQCQQKGEALIAALSTKTEREFYTRLFEADSTGRILELPKSATEGGGRE